jgi:hypothetical protein
VAGKLAGVVDKLAGVVDKLAGVVDKLASDSLNFARIAALF